MLKKKNNKETLFPSKVTTCQKR